MKTASKTLYPQLVDINYTSNLELLKNFSNFTDVIKGFEKQIALSFEYYTALVSNDPVTNIANFYKKLDSNEFNMLENDFVDFWVKKYKTSIQPIKDLVSSSQSNTSFYNNISDCIGGLLNSSNKLDDSVIPMLDKNYEIYKSPNVIPVSIQNKISNNTKSLISDMSLKTSKLLRGNLYKLFFVTDDKNPYVDSLSPHSSLLVTDLYYYTEFNNMLYNLVFNLANIYNNIYTYVQFYSNIGNKLAYNPRDPKYNLQKVTDLTFSLNVEDFEIFVDLLQRKYKKVLSDKTIKSTLTNEKTDNQNNTSQSTTSVNQASNLTN